MPRIAKVALEKATYAIDKPYDYLAPEELHLQVGCRVLVPFGRGNRTSEGVVLALQEAAPARPLKSIRLNLDQEPLITEREIRLALWMTKRYFCTFYDAIRTILPAAVWYSYQECWEAAEPLPADASDTGRAIWLYLQEGAKTTAQVQSVYGEGALTQLHALHRAGAVKLTAAPRRKVRDKTVELARLCVPAEEALAALPKGAAVRMRDAVLYLQQNGESSLHDLTYFTGVSRQGIGSLRKRGLIALRSQETYRLTPRPAPLHPAPIVLTDEQESAFTALLSQCLEEEPGVTLLQGVTGSGKTLIYIRLTQELLRAGKSVMILVPEIALTPQMMARFSGYFGSEVALLHSGLRMTERYDQWKRIRRGEAHVVLGTRSAVFAPLRDLGLIILDEEQESSYESESAPCYHARDIAKYRCAAEGARLLLGSATPTVESAYYARQGDYKLQLLRRRYNEKNLPRVMICDMRRELGQGNFTCISEPLRRELEENLSRGEQSILFLNRRGASRQLLCPQCGFVPQCPRCSVYLTYHSANGRMMCHYCGYSERAPEVCPDCGGPLKQVGIGTQKAAEELQALFPHTEILRMDADTVAGDHEAILRRFEQEKVPILLGTQMVAKGLDFENVTLVGVLAADMGLYVEHYRASERTFSLLTQVVGRAGRGEKAGRAVIQTYTPENDVILAAAQQDYERFYEAEIRLRRLRRDPPFADQLLITVSGPEEGAVRRAAGELASALRQAVAQPLYARAACDVLGPAPAPVVKVNGRYRYRVLLLCQADKPLRELVSGCMLAFSRRSEHRGMGIYTDYNLMD